MTATLSRSTPDEPSSSPPSSSSSVATSPVTTRAPLSSDTPASSSPCRAAVARRRRELDRLRAEHALYRRMLDPRDDDAASRRLEQALAALVDVSDARRGWIELRDAGADPLGAATPDAARTWQCARGRPGARSDASDEAGETLPCGLVQRVLLTGGPLDRSPVPVAGRPVEVDPDGPAVIGAPIRGDGVTGAVCLAGGAPFEADDRARLELFAHLAAPLAARVIATRRRADAGDAMQELRRLYGLRGVVGRSAALAEPCRQAMRVAPLDLDVLLTGASGTGKSQLARLIHENSPRSAGPFVELNCAALPEGLIESELFGAQAGSHSQARHDVPGKVAAAEGGTLFLDEIAELPTAAQAKLLQLIQSRDYYPLGATRPAHADVRLLSATNADLAQAVEAGRFRADLYFRLSVMPIRLPTLAERRDDVPAIAIEIARRVTARHGLPECEFGPAALRALRAADWPGNVRQLANVVEAATIRAATDGAVRVDVHHVFPEGEPSPTTGEQGFHDATRAFQRDLVAHALDAAGWNVSEAARRLGLARSHVYNLIHAFSLCRSDEDAAPSTPARPVARVRGPAASAVEAGPTEGGAVR